VAVEKPRYSLADEARFVLGHRKNAFEAGKKLRNMPVEFVSAGMLEGTIKDKEKQEVKAAVPDSGSESDDESIAPSTSSSMSPPDNTRAMAQMAIRSPSPALSEASSGSSDEVIFQGRGNSSAPLSMTTSRVESPLPPQKQVNAVAEAVNNAVDVANAKAEVVAAQVAASASVPVEDVQVQPNINVSIRVKGIVAHSHVSLDHLIKSYQNRYLPPPSLLLSPTQTPALTLIRTSTLSPIVRSLNVVETRLDGRALQQSGSTGQSPVLVGCQSRIVSPWTRFSLMTSTLAMQLWTTICRTSRTLV
jgi:hypothetical protein